jgi:hypothetical protein
MHAPEVLHRSLQLGDRDGQHTVLNIQFLDLVIKKSPDCTECRARLTIPLYLARPECVSIDLFLSHIG